MVIKFYRTIAAIGAILWMVLGVLTIGSIIQSSIGWGINLVMGVFFMLIGCFLYFRAFNLGRFYENSSHEIKQSPHFKRFLGLDLILVLVVLFFGGVFLIGGIVRVFGEGFAIFG